MHTLHIDVVTGNVYNGVVLKWTEPLDAAPASKCWRVYVFKGDDLIETLHLHRQSAFLFGRETRLQYFGLGLLKIYCIVILKGR